MSTPRIWARFSRIVDGNEVKFRIQEVGSKHYEEILKLYLDYYMPEEAVHKAADLVRNDEAVREYIEHYLGPAVSEHCQIDVCCLDDDSGAFNIVAGSIMYIDKKDGPKWNGREILKVVKTKQMKKFLQMAIYMAEAYNKDFREKLDLDLYYDDVGIVVHKDYRGLSIAGEIFKARMLPCKEYGVPAAGAWMTSIASQKAAAKLGWTTVLELSYKDIGEIGGVSYDEPVPSAKYMIVKV